jgi:hypothetical protein
LRQSSATLKEEKLSHIEWKMEAEIWAGFARFFTCKKFKGKVARDLCIFLSKPDRPDSFFTILEITDGRVLTFHKGLSA